MVALTLLGALLLIVGGIGTLIAAFRTSVWWGLGCLLISPVSLVFLIVHWSVAKNPFFLQLVGLALVLVGGGFGERAH